jgi:AraC-like DNA-binding protein/tetratricopeptide (TPR) repeat protein/TolB-like protein
MADDHNSGQAFILALTDIVLRNLKNEDFRIRDLARESGLSSSTLNRRLSRIAGKSGNEFIREIRLRKAHEMLQGRSANVSEVSYAVGFSSPAYFSACFHEYFGYPPSKVTKDRTFNLPYENIAEQAGFKKQIKSIREFLRVYRPWILSFLMAAAGIIIFFYVKATGSSSLDDLTSGDGRIPVAVMPFDNLTGNRTWDCIQMNLISYLSNFDELTVRQKEAVDILLQGRGISEQASLTPALASAISRKLDSKVYISGVISQDGKQSRIYVQMVNSKTREVIKSFQVEDDSDEHKIFDVIDSVSTIVKNFLLTAKMTREIYPDLRPYRYTNSPVAFEYFIKADDALQKKDIRTSLSWYLKTVEADSTFIPAIIFLSMRYGDLGDYAEAKKWCLKAYSLKDQAHLKDKYMIEWYHAVLFGKPEEEAGFLKQYICVDDNVPVAYWQLGNAYSKLMQFKSAIPEYEKTLEIYKKWGVRPIMINNYITLIEAFHKTGQYNKEKRLIKIADRSFPEDSWILWKYRAILAYAERDTIAGNRYVEEYRSEMAGRSMPATEILSKIASLYIESGNIEKAEKYAREAYSLNPDDPITLNRLAYLLIDKELDVSEGLRLATEGLKIKPDDHSLLHTLGWGLSKAGRYKEALENLNRSWESRLQYNHTLLQHIGEVQRQISTSN